MRKLTLIFACLLLWASPAWATIYYVDCAADGDAGAGTSTAANVAWKTIAKVNASSFTAGDSILFKRGCTWREMLTVPSSGSAGSPITFRAYGTGDNPIISGSNLVTAGWSKDSANIWKATLTTQPTILYFNDTRGTLVAAKANITAEYKWYWASNVLYVWSPNDDDPSGHHTAPGLEAGARSFGVSISTKDYVTLQSLHTTKTNALGVILDTVNYIILDDVDSGHNYISGIDNLGDATDVSHSVTVKNGDYSYNGRSGIEVHAGGVYGQWDTILIQRNTVHHNAWSTGASIYTSGIKIWGGGNGTNLSHDAIIEHNEVCSNASGESGLGRGAGIWVDEFGTGAVVRNNLVHDNDYSGILIEHHAGTTVYYNILYNNCLFWTSFPNLFVSRLSDAITVYNNVIYGGEVGIGIWGSDTEQVMHGILVRNNIVAGTTARALSATRGGENAGAGSGNVYAYNSFGPETGALMPWSAHRSSRSMWRCSCSPGAVEA